MAASLFFDRYDKHTGHANPQKDALADKFAEWAGHRYNVTLSRNAASKLLGFEETSCTHQIGKVRVMLWNPVGLPSTKFGLVDAESEQELRPQP